MARRPQLLGDILIGTGCSLLASAITYHLVDKPDAAVATGISVGAIVGVTVAWLQYRKLSLLRRLGVSGWDERMSAGTSTLRCIEDAHSALIFAGIAASKWLAHPVELRRMLKRLANSGGCAQFLLLNPDSEACATFERQKHVPAGSIAEIIRQNAYALSQLESDGLPVVIAYYDYVPRFRLVMVDDEYMTVGLYSINSDDGDSPQLVLRQGRSEWSFYFGFRALLSSMVGGSNPQVARTRARNNK